MLLKNIDDVPKATDDSEEAHATYVKQYKAEAHFLRAYFYWEMFLRYGPVPLVTDVLDPDGDLLSNYTTRPSLKEYVVDFILKELKDCRRRIEGKATSAERQPRTYQPANGTCTVFTCHALHGKRPFQK